MVRPGPWGEGTRPGRWIQQSIAELSALSGSLWAAIDRVFEKLDIDWSDLGDRAHFAEPPLPEDCWARDLVAVHGMPAVLKALARHAKGRGWREAFRELSRARGQPQGSRKCSA